MCQCPDPTQSFNGWLFLSHTQSMLTDQCQWRCHIQFPCEWWSA
ncbi:unnamed protein product [Oppiella nova]|uniref:Uncharacterized protein n=1 Tax=Oppiella nova TaxID=334625 RepID=A0A7R9MSQ6_9ACAR|nr:unnamed protein product [Oppiella nova]CAG2182625.1 unnamed protein product [Oppiella nova]